jgi:hypothetical protein
MNTDEFRQREGQVAGRGACPHVIHRQIAASNSK